MIVNLTYFTFTGSYRTEGSYRTKFDYILDIYREVKELLDSGSLPGLISGKHKLLVHVHVDVPAHPHNHPVLILPRGVLIHD